MTSGLLVTRQRAKTCVNRPFYDCMFIKVKQASIAAGSIAAQRSKHSKINIPFYESKDMQRPVQLLSISALQLFVHYFNYHINIYLCINKNNLTDYSIDSCRQIHTFSAKVLKSC